MPSRPGIATSWLAHSAAASFEAGSIARFATSANSTRSTSVVNRRPPRTLRSAVSTSRAFHSPCSSHAAPAGREDDQPQPVGGRVGAGRRRGVGPVGVGFAEVAVDRADQPAQPVGVEPVLPAQVEQHVRLRRRPDALVVGQGQVAHDRAVLVRPRGRPQVHDRTRPHPSQVTQASTRRNVCPHFRALQQGDDPLTRHIICRTSAHVPINCGTRGPGGRPHTAWCAGARARPRSAPPGTAPDAAPAA